MSKRFEMFDGVSRRTVMKASAVGATSLGVGVPAAANRPRTESGEVDEPNGFEIEVLSRTGFVDDLAAHFRLKFADGGGTIPSNLSDGDDIVLGEVRMTENGRSGWHVHPGVAFVTILEGELDVTWERDCGTRTYGEEDSFFDPGIPHNVVAPDGALFYVLFVGIPEGEPATEWIVPPDC